MIRVVVPGLLMWASVLASANGPAPATAPAVPREMAAYAGKVVTIRYDLDLDGDGRPTPAETEYLATHLRAAGAKVQRSALFLKGVDVLILGRLAPPNEPLAADQTDGVFMDRHDAAKATYANLEKDLADLRAQAKAAGVTVLTADDVPKTFGLAKPTREQIAAVGLARHAVTLARRFPEVSMDGVALADSLDFLSDVADLHIAFDRAALHEAGVRQAAPTAVIARGLPLNVLLDLVVDSGGAGKLAYVTDGSTLLVTSAARAKALRAEPAGNWKSPEELPPVPAATTQPDPIKPAVPQPGVEAPPPLPPFMTPELVKATRPRIHLTDVSLPKALLALRQVTNWNVYVSPADLDVLKIDHEAPVTVNRDNAPADLVLAEFAASLTGGKLVFYCDRGYVMRLATPERAAEAVKENKASFLLPITK